MTGAYGLMFVPGQIIIREDPVATVNNIPPMNFYSALASLVFSSMGSHLLLVF
jgi:hypothetical protein